MHRTSPLLGILTLSFFALAGCGDDVVTRDPAEPAAGAETPSARPPSPPQDGVPPDGPGLSFAISQLRLGTPADGSWDEWESLGFDLDGVVTRDGGSETCRSQSGPKLDGRGGRDNALGRDLLGGLRGIDAAAEESAQQLVASGGFTTLLTLAGVEQSAAYLGLLGAGFSGAPFTDDSGARSTPAWDGSDVWPVTADSVNGSLEAPRLRFDEAYLAPDGAGGTWVGHGKGPLELRIPLHADDITAREWTFHMTILDPLIVAPLSADRTRIVGGTVAGVLDPEALAVELARIGEIISPGYCADGGLAKMVPVLLAMADIHADFRDDPGVDCGSLSAGLSFDAERVILGAVAPAEAPLDNPCAE